jgi:hypothetical protein
MLLSKNKIRKIILFVVIFLGLAISFFSSKDDNEWLKLLYGVGISLVTTGMIGLFNLYIEQQARYRGLIRIKMDSRNGFKGYNEWLNINKPFPKNVELMGHSVLHSTNKALNGRIVPKFVGKIKKGSKIQVVFYDPTYDIVEKLSSDIAGKTSAELYPILLKSLDVVNEFHTALTALHQKNANTVKGTISINIAKHPILHAYHHIKYKKKEYAYLGFYFSGIWGYKTPPYQIEDSETLQLFERDFDCIFNNKSTQLFHYKSDSGAVLSANFSQIYDHVKRKITPGDS